MKKENRTETDYKKVIKRLHFAWEELRKHNHKDTPGRDGITINIYAGNYSERIEILSEMLSKEKFKFSPLRHALVEKGREILIQTVDERIVAEAVYQVIGPQLEKLNSQVDYSRPVEYTAPKGSKQLGAVPLASKVIVDNFKLGYVWVLEADIKGFFDNVPKKKILQLLNKHIRDKKVLSLIRQMIYFKVDTSKKSKTDYSSKIGIAQGSPLSPILASIYLYEFDMYIKEEFPNVRLVRYVDDFIILCKDEKTARDIYEKTIAKLSQMGLYMYKLGEVSPKGAIKTKITCARGYNSSSFDFLGLTFNHTDIDISKKKKEEILEKIKEIIKTTDGNFFQKIKRVESRLLAYIKQYRMPHYTRTVDSIKMMIRVSKEELESNYISTYKKITGKDAFSGIDNTTKDKVFNFMGINFNNILKKLTNN
jgi:retron-type reverse transcriptase/ribosomal protein S6